MKRNEVEYKNGAERRTHSGSQQYNKCNNNNAQRSTQMLVHRLNTSILFVQQALRISFARSLVRICLIVVSVYPSHICVYFVRTTTKLADDILCDAMGFGIRRVRFFSIIYSCCTHVERLGLANER